MQNTPATGMARASGNVSVGTADTFQIAPHRSEVQTQHIRRRFGLPPSTAAVVASLAYPALDTWRARA